VLHPACPSSLSFVIPAPLSFPRRRESMWHPLSSSSSVVLAKARVRVAPPLVPLHFHSSFLRPCHSREGENPCGTAVHTTLYSFVIPVSSSFPRRRESMRHHHSSSLLLHSHKGGVHAAPLLILPYLHSLFLRSVIPAKVRIHAAPPFAIVPPSFSRRRDSCGTAVHTALSSFVIPAPLSSP